MTAVFTIDLFIINGLAVADHTLTSLSGWLFLNSIIIIPIIALKYFLSRRGAGNDNTLEQKYDEHLSRFRTDNRHSPQTQRQSYGVPNITLNREVVKSFGEKKIADYLYENDIKYEYEKPAMSSDGRRRISRPDFFLPDFNVYVEYWGMVNTDDDHTRQEYIKSMEWKITKYQENNKKLISIYPEDLGKLDSVIKTKLKETTGLKLD